MSLPTLSFLRHNRISWQGHLFGFVGGILIARYLPELRQWFGTF
ncbi:rhomboid family intramembrane serine protease [Phormidesmis priestleyi]|nr:rhomboid family intramembrane serine protease [Phormidesmis priestleyi]